MQKYFLIKNFGKNFAKNYRIPTITFQQSFFCTISHPSLHRIVRVCLPVASPPLKGAGGMLLPSLPPVPTSYCSCMVARRISPFEGGRGDVSSQASHLSLHHIVRVCLPVASPPLKEVRELAQRSMCQGGCFLPTLPPVPTSYCSCMLARRISPFEGGRGDVYITPPKKTPSP